MSKALALLINLELFKLEKLMEDVFCKNEDLDFYKKLNGADEHLNATRRAAEIKRYYKAKMMVSVK